MLSEAVFLSYNMREIKFRLWSKTAQSIIPWERVQTKPNTIFDNTNYESMQFIGLQDKNERDIYEGDILKTKLDIICKVEYSNQYAKFMLVDKDDVRWAFDHKSYIEVVGNVYENRF